MSAFMVSGRHIDYLVTAAEEYRCLRIDADEAVAMLTRENARSVRYRYSENPDAAAMAPDPDEVETRFPDDLRLPITPVTVLKAVNCYEYQSCEHPAWEESAAHKLCIQLEGAAVSRLPGYAEAPWGIE